MSLRQLVQSLGVTAGLDLRYVVEAAVGMVGERKSPTPNVLHRSDWTDAVRRSLSAERRRALVPTTLSPSADPIRSVLEEHHTRFPGRAVDALSLSWVLGGSAVKSAGPNPKTTPALIVPRGLSLSRDGELLLLEAVDVDRGHPGSPEAEAVAKDALRREEPGGDATPATYDEDVLHRFLVGSQLLASDSGRDDARDVVGGPTHRTRVPGFDTESLDGVDLLDIKRDVHGLAALVAARTVVPPLSIGLFGSWGSGKSFFMRKLRERIRALADATSAREKDGLPSSFHGHVVQIEFNAWNYIEVDLWASLVTHIFEQLHRHFVPRKTEREQWYQLLRELDDAEETRDETQRALLAAEAKLAEAKADFEGLRLSLVKHIDILWQAVKEDPKTDEALKDALRKLDDDLDPDAARELLRKVAEHRENFEHIRPHLPGYWRIAANNLWNVVGIAVVASAIVAVLATVVLYVMAQAKAGTWAQDFWARLLEAAVPVVAFATAVRQTVAKGVDIGKRVEAIRVHAVKELDEAKARRPEAMELAKAESGLAKAKAEAETQAERVAELRTAERRLRPNERLATFLEDRAGSEDYRKYLGLPAMIRRDFEKLHRLLGELREQTLTIPADAALWAGLAAMAGARTNDDDETPKLPEIVRQRVDATGVPLRSVEVRRADYDGAETYVVKEKGRPRTITVRRTAAGATLEIAWALPRIDRIVLYIDDLDRCPADRVVEVLQAVHMLLAFPLFVVVVGVDSRWITRSLQQQHPELFSTLQRAGLQTDQGPVAERPSGRATARPLRARETIGLAPSAHPHDYLEKIFQIPYWLEPINERESAEMLEHLVGRTGGTANAGVSGRDWVDGASGAPLDCGSETPAEHGDDPPTGTEGDSTQGSGAAAPPSGPAAVDGLAGDEDTMMAPQLTVLDVERDAMQRLAELIGRSPRAIKRYVNAYRLLRARMSAEELEAFVADGQSVPRYELAAFLLAVMVGAPDVAEALFRELNTPAHDKPLTPSVVVAWGKALADSGERWPVVQAAVDALLDRSSGRSPITFGQLRAVLGDVRRLSFRFGAG